jgi:hypothetical protein
MAVLAAAGGGTACTAAAAEPSEAEATAHLSRQRAPRRQLEQLLQQKLPRRWLGALFSPTPVQRQMRRGEAGTLRLPAAAGAGPPAELHRYIWKTAKKGTAYFAVSWRYMTMEVSDICRGHCNVNSAYDQGQQRSAFRSSPCCVVSEYVCICCRATRSGVVTWCSRP